MDINYKKVIFNIYLRKIYSKTFDLYRFNCCLELSNKKIYNLTLFLSVTLRIYMLKS